MASRHFRHLPRASPRWSMPRAPWFFSCGRATAPPIIRSPVHLPRHLRPAPQVYSRPSSSISRSRSCTYCHAFLCSRHSVSGEPRVVQPFILLAIRRKARRIRTPNGPAVPLHSLPATRKASPDPGRSSRPSHSLSAARKAYPDPECPAVHLYSPSAARKAYPDPEWSSRSSSVSIRCQEGVSGIPGGPAVHLTRYPPPGMRIRTPSVQPFIFTRHPPPGRRIRTATGSGVHLHFLYASRKAFPNRDWSRRLSSLAIRRQEGVSRPRLVQAFIFTRYPPPGGRIRIPSGPGVHPHSLSASRKAYRDPEWSRRSSSLAIRRQEGVSGPRVVQAFIRTRYPPPERRIGTPSGPVVYLHSPSAARKACPDPGWSSRSSSLAIRLQKGVSGPRVVQPFIFTRYPPPGRRIRTAGGPAVHLHSLSAARKAYPDPEWSRRSSSPAFRCQEGVSRPRAVQAFILTRYPLPGRRLRTPSGPAVHLRSLSAARKAYRDPECPAVHFYSLFAARKAYRDPQGSIRSSSVAIRRQEGGSGPRLVQAFIFARLSASRKAYTVPRGQPFFLTRLSAVRRTHADRGWSSRSRQLAYLPPGSRFRFAHAFSRSS